MDTITIVAPARQGFAQPASEEQIARTVEALEAKAIHAIVVDDRSAACEALFF